MLYSQFVSFNYVRFMKISQTISSSDINLQRNSFIITEEKSVCSLPTAHLRYKERGFFFRRRAFLSVIVFLKNKINYGILFYKKLITGSQLQKKNKLFIIIIFTNFTFFSNIHTKLGIFFRTMLLIMSASVHFELLRLLC